MEKPHEIISQIFNTVNKQTNKAHNLKVNFASLSTDINEMQH